MSKIRFGILGAANIATEYVIPAMQAGRHTEVVAIASRSLEKAQHAATRLGIPKAFGAYDELLADPNVDAVYNPLPNNLHVPYSIKALEAGKHVLCEKPIAPTAAEGQRLVDAGRKHPARKLMEAFMYRHHPQWVAARQLVDDGNIGALRTIHAFFSYYDDDPAAILNQPDLGGGGLLDIGCYPISLSRFLFDRQPQRVFGIVEYDPRFNVDRLASGILDFGDGTATFTCATQLADYQRVNIFGTTGRVEIEIPFNAPSDRPCVLHHQAGEYTEEIAIDTCDQYTIQGDLFAQAILNDTDVPTPIEDAVDNMKVLEAIVRSGKNGTWETL